MIAQLKSQVNLIVLAALFALVVGIVPLLLQWWRRWRQARAARVPASSSGLARVAGIKPDRLLKIWRRFLLAQPWRQRAAIAAHPSVIVLGAAGAGKSLLIDTQVDWMAQQQRFFPSATDDPLLQIYVGGKVTVQELSPALLADDSAPARRALTRLWRAQRHAPSVIVVLDGTQLAHAAPDEIRRQAQLVRGKLHLLHELHGQPMRVSVCLTHMDAIDGFADLVQVCRRHQLPSAPELSGFVGGDEPRSLFAPHEPHLPLALTTLPAERYRRVVELLGEASAAGAALGAFLVPLAEASPLSAPPRLERLYQFAPDPALQVESLFAPLPLAPAKKSRVSPALLRCVAIAAPFATWVGAAHYNHARKLARAESAVAQLSERVQAPGDATDATPPPPDDPLELLTRADRALDELRGAERWWPLLRESARPEKRALVQAIVDDIRRGFLLPALAQCQVACREPTLYTLAVLYAGHDDALGKLVTQEARHFAGNLALPELAITGYVRWTTAPWRQAPSLGLLSRLLSGDALTAGERPWQAFLEQLQAAYDSEELTGQLGDLRARAHELALALERSRAFIHVPLLLRLLPAVAPPELASLVRAPHQQSTLTWLSANAAPLEGLLTMVQKGDVSPSLLGRMTAGAFVAHLDSLVRDRDDRPYVITLGRRYAFAQERWLELVARTSLRVYVQQPGYPFLPRTGSDDAAPLAPAEGLYHRSVVEGAIKPALDELTERLSHSPLPAADKSALAAYVLDQMSLYAQRYRDTLLAVGPFHFDVRSAPELQGALVELARPSSGLMRWLHRLADDADLGALDTPYLRPLADAVAPLQPVVRLVKPGKDAGPGGLGKYVALVTRLSRELAGVERDVNAPPPSPPQPPSDDGGPALDKLLTPLGRAALAMLLTPQSSYSAEVKLWLDEVGLEGELRKPFLEPFDRLLDFGVPELEAALQTQWTRQWSQVAPIFAKYPFRRDAKRDVTPDELEALRPGGPFWSQLHAVEGPFCVQRGATWVARLPLLRVVSLPPGMLGHVNLVARLARVFWDKEGKRIPLALSVTPLPLPKELGLDGYVTMSFLRAGGAAVFGFNQRPTARAFAPAWWSSDGASVGISFGDGDGKAIPDRSLDVAESTWSLYRLLERARAADDTLSFVIPDAFRHRPLAVRFVVRGDPVALRPWTLINGR